MRTLIIKSSFLTIVAAGVIFVTVASLRPEYEGVRAGKADENYIESGKCVSCHPAHHASWAQTFHRTMTQEALPEAIKGDFERDNTYEYLGVRARMERRGDKYSMSLAFPDGSSRLFTVDRTVGSRRIQQYLTKQAGGYVRLPLAYDLVNQRWMSLNGSFFHPDGDNYFQHQAQWDPNCVFCHNVKAQPHIDFNTKQFSAEVAEIGIACGACHGPAATHAETAASPLTRTLWRISESSEKSIVNPARIDSDRSLMVCGHCHGQRVPQPMDRIQEILTRGDPYNAGDDLRQFYQPVTRETKIGNFSFANRFWANGSPRLTAYEYQGILRSKCFTAGEAGNRINCLSCHSMHEGDPRGQIKAENRTDRPCLECHKEYEPLDALAAHTKHKAESTGSRCYNCHMPRVVYGVMSVHPTHDITVPDPSLTVTKSMPNACSQCHLDKSINWAIRSAKSLWPEKFASIEPSSDEQFDVAEGPRALFAGDALMRALAAEAMGGGGPASIDSTWARPYLVEAFTDNYPIVRFFVANGLSASYREFPKLDYLGSPTSRASSLDRWRGAIDASSMQQVVKLVEWLKQKRIEVDIEVGE
jgi:predicted CXXCH cytochrome family protein